MVAGAWLALRPIIPIVSNSVGGMGPGFKVVSIDSRLRLVHDYREQSAGLTLTTVIGP